MSQATKERPINLKAWEVKAIMDRRLSQLRRRIKPHGDYLGSGGKANREEWDDPKCWGWEDSEDPGSFIVLSRDPDSGDKSSKCPYGVPGDRLWVRETFATGYEVEEGCLVMADEDGEEIPETVYYRATDPYLTWMDDDGGMTAKVPWKPSIFMPRWASRITLEITNLSVERIQDISEDDARAEGVMEWLTSFDGRAYDNIEQQWCRRQKTIYPSSSVTTPLPLYSILWDKINGPGSWDRNDWVWVISFRRIYA